MSTTLPSPIISRRKTDSWCSPAHPCVSVRYSWNSEVDPVDIHDIRVVGSMLEQSTRKFFQRFGIDMSSTDEDWLDELAQHLHNIHPRGVDPDVGRD